MMYVIIHEVIRVLIVGISGLCAVLQICGLIDEGKEIENGK